MTALFLGEGARDEGPLNALQDPRGDGSPRVFWVQFRPPDHGNPICHLSP